MKKNILDNLESWANKNTSNKELWDKVFACKVIVHFCKTSPIRAEYETMLETMIDSIKSSVNFEDGIDKATEKERIILRFLAMFDVQKNATDVKIYLKEEPEEEEVGMEPVLIASFKLNAINDIARIN